MPHQPNRKITIPAGATESLAFGSGQGKGGAFQLPTGFEGTSVTIKISNDGVTFTNAPIEGNETNPLTVDAGGTYVFPVKTLYAGYLQLVAGSAQAVAQQIAVFMRD